MGPLEISEVRHHYLCSVLNEVVKATFYVKSQVLVNCLYIVRLHSSH